MKLIALIAQLSLITWYSHLIMGYTLLGNLTLALAVVIGIQAWKYIAKDF